MFFLSDLAYLPSDTVEPQQHSPPQKTGTAEKKQEFKLPEANEDMHRVYAYLIKQRHIAAETITHFAKAHTLFEDKEHHNVVFVGQDENGVPRQASKRSATTFGNSFRMTVGGSDTRYSFGHFGTSNRLYVFEAPIDMLSFITLYPDNWQEHSYITLNGVYEHPLIQAGMSSAREFLFIYRFRKENEEKVFSLINRIGKAVADHGFMAHRLEKAEIKRMLGLYFGTSIAGGDIPDEEYSQKGGSDEYIQET